MLLVFDNIIFSLQRAGGISVVWENLLSELARRGEDFTCIEYDGASQNIHRQELSLPAGRIEHRKMRHRVIEQFVSPSYEYEGNKPFVFHSSFFRVCPSRWAKNVTTVHDFIYERQTRMTLSQRIRSALNHRAIRRSDVVVCVSENTRDDLFRYLPEVDRKKVHVIHNGVSSDYHRLGQRVARYEGYVAYVGGRQSYKNFDFAVEGIAGSNLKMLVCGKPLTEPERQMLDSKLGSGRYAVAATPSNAELNSIYNSVDALLYPSSYEGFGLPVLEAQRAGCPVIAMNASSIPEITGDSALLIDRVDVRLLHERLKTLESPAARAEIIEAGLENAKKYSWCKMAEAYAELYAAL